MMNKPRIETERLVLTWPDAYQIEQYYLDIKDSDMFKTIQWDGPKSPQDLHDYWNNCSKINPCLLEEGLHIAIIDKHQNKYLGGAALRPVDRNPAIIDIGFALAPKYHRKGFATEVVKAMIIEAFKNRRAQRVFANIFVGNMASRNVVEKVGFQFEGTQRRTVLKYGKWVDKWLFAMIRPDWEEQQN